MSDKPAQNYVGTFIREKREAVKLSQRSLGQLFDPPVTTQFISNIERGVTPLPPVHVSTLVRALKIQESDLLQVMEQEYSAKISNRLGRPDAGGALASHVSIPVAQENADIVKKLADSLTKADPENRQRIRQAIQQILDSFGK
jgi:transcriptional regulator with XRE-family HTH domain